ncbi:MAG: M3 family metallopeptidase [bacterium]
MGRILDILRGKQITSLEAAVDLISARFEIVQDLITETIHDVAALKCSILAVPADQRTYANTVLAYDELCGVNIVLHAITSILRCVSADIAQRDIPYEVRKKEMAALIHDPALYEALREYRNGPMEYEVLTTEQYVYVETLMDHGRRSGYDQAEEQRWQLAALKKQMDAAASSFESNYNADVTVISVPENQLQGVDSSFIAMQPRDAQGNIAILCNLIAWHAIMPYCRNPEVRRTFYQAYYQRAYPANEGALKQLLIARTAYAQAVGFIDYASYSLASCMLATADEVLDFLKEFTHVAKPLFTRMIDEVRQDTPEGVVLVEGALQPWDVAYVLAVQEQKYCALDQREVSQYFPIDAVISGMLRVYSRFMDVSFEFESKLKTAWHETVQGVTVFNRDKSRVLGYVVFDLLPRPQKYSHACCWQIIPRIRRYNTQTGMLYETPAIATIIANIPLPHGDAPSLLHHDTVRMLFHEFGHALHAVLSCTSHFQTSGLKGVMRDYIELPSQILEEWIWRPEILRMLSSHYITGQVLPDDLMQRLAASREIEQGFFEMNQARRALLSLRLFMGEGSAVDINAEARKAHEECLPGIMWDDAHKEYASFGHLVPYGPRYFGYILSRIYARDVFAHIERRGLLNTEIGTQFVECMLRPGGSRHPRRLLESFLGRPVSNAAYFEWLEKKGDFVSTTKSPSQKEE